MSVYICPHCKARNTDAGRCVLCHKNMGSLRRAAVAAFGTSFVLSLIWIISVCITKLELTMLAVAFGIIVSFSTAHFSRGHGPLYQALATTATILGLLVSETVAILIISNPDGLMHVARMTTTEWHAALSHFLTDDPVTAILMLFGVIGGFFIWRPA